MINDITSVLSPLVYATPTLFTDDLNLFLPSLMTLTGELLLQESLDSLYSGSTRNYFKFSLTELVRAQYCRKRSCNHYLHLKISPQTYFFEPSVHLRPQYYHSIRLRLF